MDDAFIIAALEKVNIAVKGIPNDDAKTSGKYTIRTDRSRYIKDALNAINVLRDALKTLK